MTVMTPDRLLFTGADWTYETIQRINDACETIAHGEMGLKTYPNQIEIITTEQMLDAYSSVGMPLFYGHWSFGKSFAHHEASYRKGLRGLAYEIVINSNPCVSYIMEENSATMQTLVIAHAAFGHNHFFRNNYLFKQWTQAEGILGYLDFAKTFIADCEERYGHVAVERVLDAAHALQSHGVHRYPRKRKPDLASEQRRERDRREHQEQMFNDLWRTVPEKEKGAAGNLSDERRKALLELPQENILYFVEKTAPRLAPWQREIIRIVRLIAQYFYPQGQTKLMNEGCATYCHYQIMGKLYETGQISEGSYLEFLGSHTNVVMQPDYDDKRFGGINPYALGFAMMQDIERIVVAPTDEDREWFPDIAGRGDPYAVLADVWANYRDESFVSQFLSPHLMRRWKLFHVQDEGDPKKDLRVAAIHDERGYRGLRRALSRHYDVAWQDPDIQVIDVDLAGDRRLMVQHNVLNGVLMSERETREVLQHLADLWGYDVHMREVDQASGKLLKEHSASARATFLQGG
ncbi:SpoVR family protein [Lichenibacterium ramalinae]|uniref:SpoVR family protein n=1 Tax=Lichenibacterium ramalinae TaxID=2316527 RepID=A0A4Q2RCE9_9HYPH|nr:SpoVR family protein [Lichenibacterium ramalinae]RYB03473.1 SpoVR family protein [Lichenibacterium ramalinae]